MVISASKNFRRRIISEVFRFGAREDMQLIGIVGDINGEEDTQHIELARTITERANADYIHLIPTGQSGS